jgi:RNA-binding protein
MKSLTPAQRQYLKGLAHSRQPVVMIGNNGLTPAVLKEIDHALNAHELMTAATGAAPVQQIGKVLVIYRAADKPVIVLPA